MALTLTLPPQAGEGTGQHFTSADFYQGVGLITSDAAGLANERRNQAPSALDPLRAGTRNQVP